MFNDDFEIDFVDGDLLDFVGDAVVVNTNIRLNLNYSLGKAILEKAGQPLESELQDILHDRFSDMDLPLGTAVSTNAYGLSDHVRKLIFVSWWNQDNEYTVNHIFKVHAAAIREADALGLRTIAFPLMGRGHRVKYSIIAEGIAITINELNKLEKRFSVEKVVFISLQKEDVESVRRLVEAKLMM
jgi:O-acetyl-ADP-ribose deacetylase (regulator of RNase III)